MNSPSVADWATADPATNVNERARANVEGERRRGKDGIVFRSCGRSFSSLEPSTRAILLGRASFSRERRGVSRTNTRLFPTSTRYGILVAWPCALRANTSSRTKRASARSVERPRFLAAWRDASVLEASSTSNGRKVVVGDRIGEGGMGVVHRGWLYYNPAGPHAGTPAHPVAIKVLHPILKGRERARRLFLGEANALARLSHPNIVHFFALSQSEGGLAIMLELVEGEALQRCDRSPSDRSARSAACPCMPFLRAWHFFSQLLGALAGIHALGIIHRDVKPCERAHSDRRRRQAHRLRNRAASRGRSAHDRRHGAGHRGVHGPRAGARQSPRPPDAISTAPPSCSTRC